jgi:hypothetical protein
MPRLKLVTPFGLQVHPLALYSIIAFYVAITGFLILMVTQPPKTYTNSLDFYPKMYLEVTGGDAGPAPNKVTVESEGLSIQTGDARPHFGTFMMPALPQCAKTLILSDLCIKKLTGEIP